MLVLAMLSIFFLATLLTTELAQVRENLLQLEKDDRKLISTMKEGLLLLDKASNDIKFGSKAALRIIGHK